MLHHNRVLHTHFAMSSLAHANRFARAIQLAMLVACVAFVLGALAHAGHFHKKSDSAGHEDTICQLCLQFDRTAPPSTGASVQLTSIFLTLAALPANVIVALTPRPSFYRARGPPQP